MPTPTYDLIASNVLSSSASSVTFSSIPATYRDLVLVANYANGHNDIQGHWLRINSDTGTNYSSVRMTGDGSTSVSGTESLGFAYMEFYFINVNETRLTKVDFLDYATTDKHKTFLMRSDSSAKSTEARAIRWANTNAITQIDLGVTAGNYPAGSTFYLYGIVS